MKHRRRNIDKICPKCKSYNTTKYGDDKIAENTYIRITYVCSDCKAAYHIGENHEKTNY
jgi:transposase-like protein